MLTNMPVQGVPILECRICGAGARLFDTVDLHKNCNVDSGHFQEKSGINVDYYRCCCCGFIFTDFFDRFSVEDFRREIYNDDYIKVDPLYNYTRPKRNAAFLDRILDATFFRDRGAHILDYGAGSGLLSAFIEEPCRIVSYDPMCPKYSSFPEEKFELIFSSEVIEHTVHPKKIVEDWANLLDRNGIVIFSTQLQPDNIDAIKGAWWYIGPRNGHVSIFSSESLTRALAGCGLRCETLSSEWHIAYRGHFPTHLDRAKLKLLAEEISTGFVPVGANV